jgi:peroxin-13
MAGTTGGLLGSSSYNSPYGGSSMYGGGGMYGGGMYGRGGYGMGGMYGGGMYGMGGMGGMYGQGGNMQNRPLLERMSAYVYQLCEIA